MQLILTALSLSLSILPFTTAAGVCSSSGSLSWPPVGDCATPSKYSTAVQTCRACCMNDGDCFQACAKAAGLRKRDTIGEQFFGAVREKRDLTSRAVTLSCDGVERCYKFTDGSLLCLNMGTGAYHDDVGGNGNYYSGVYTGPDGKVQTGTSTATATGSRSSTTRAQTTGSTQSARGTSTGTAGTTSAVGASASSAAASASSRAAGDVLRAGANVGLVGLVAGLVL